MAAGKKDSLDRLMKDLSVDRERAEKSKGPNAHWTGRENPYLDKWEDAGEDDDDVPVVQFRGMGREFASSRVDDGEIDDDENKEYDVDAEDDIVDRGKIEISGGASYY
jgi:hypothetical protein